MAPSTPVTGSGGTPRAAASLAVGLGLLFLSSFFIAPVTIEPETMAAQVRRDTTAAQGSHAAHGASSAAAQGSFSPGAGARGLQEVEGQTDSGRGREEGKEGEEGKEEAGGGGTASVQGASGQRELATFAAGCFWSVELAFQRVPGVTKTTVGYTQGTTARPMYEDVSSGRTGHAEAVLVEYDPAQVSYERLLEAFWKKHDPTQKNGQGNDHGSQYRSGIYFHTPEQESAARLSLEQKQSSLHKKIATEILPAKDFYPAEEYHQQYLERGGRFGLKQSAEKGAKDPIRSYG